MSDAYGEPNLQYSVQCDFGPFANGPCGKRVVFTQEPSFQPPTLRVTGQTPSIQISDIMALIKDNLEDPAHEALYQKDYFGLKDNDGKVIINLPNVTYNGSEGTKSYQYKIMQVEDNAFIFGTIEFEMTYEGTDPVLNPHSKTITDNNAYSVNLLNLLTIDSSLTKTNGTFELVGTPSPELTIALTGNSPSISVPKDTAGTGTRTYTATIKYTDEKGKVSNEATITIIIKDYTLDAKDFTIGIKDSEVGTVNLNGKVTRPSGVDINWAATTFTPLSEGNITISGSTITYTPNEGEVGNRTVTTTYEVEDEYGMKDTGTITINIQDYNIWANSIRWGTSTLTELTADDIANLANESEQQDYPGKYNFAAGDYKWICYPKVWGEPIMIQDATNMMEFAMDDPRYVTAGGVELICYRSYFPLGGTASVNLI